MNHAIEGSTVIPSMRYHNAHAAIDWLCQAFGFEKHAVYEDDNGRVMHAQLTFGTGMVMLSDTKDDDFGKRLLQPDETHGRGTHVISIIVKDCKAHYERAKAAGAEIIDEYSQRGHGGAGYGCRDPEGHMWWIGSYDPWHSP